jgi:hypothetical protein
MKLVNQPTVSFAELRELPVRVKSTAANFRSELGPGIFFEELESMLVQFEVDLMLLSLTNDDDGETDG